MARFFARNLNQTATLWTLNGVDSAGDPTWDSASPRTISVRWEERNDMFINQGGEQEASVSMVVTAEDVSLGDYLFLGTSVAADPKLVDGAYAIKVVEKFPDRKARNFFRRCRL